MKIAIGCDHIGYELKTHLQKYLENKGYTVVDFGTHDKERTHYPQYGYQTAMAVAQGQCGLGILICGTGIGISITANKVHGIRAAVCSEPYSARLSKMHNNVNIIAMGAMVVGHGLAEIIVDTFLEAEYEGGRHQQRLDMIGQIEDKGALNG